MNIVDSSGWIEYFKNTQNADNFAPAIETPEMLIVPTITLFEVFKKFLSQMDEIQAGFYIGQMQSSFVAPLNSKLSLKAAKLSLQHNLPMADSLILATAHEYKATLWTQDKDFKGIAGVKYFKKK